MLKQQKRISTYVIVKVSGSSTERFLNLCRHRGIKFWDITANEDGFVGSITRTDFFKLKDICIFSSVNFILTWDTLE